MGRSHESWSKREKEKKKAKKKEEKMKRKEERSEQSPDSFDDMIAYVDQYGNPTDTPPDPTEREEVEAEDIIIGIPPKEDREDDHLKEGTVTFFDHNKGFGFIKVKGTGDSVFTHINSHLDEGVTEGNRVSFEQAKGEKGPVAINVKILK